MRLWQWALLLLLALPAHADDGPRARVSSRLDAPASVLPGQRLTYEVEVLSDALSFQGLRVVPPAISGGLLLADAVATIKGTRRVDGTAWQYVSYRYPLYAQRPGTLRVAPALVTFSAAPAPGLPTRAFRLETTDHSLPVRPLPAGMPFAAAGLEVRAAVDPAGQAVTVGDARSVTITRQLEDAPALLLAPLALPDLPGATLYPGTPVLRSESGRGRLTGIREDRFTLVFEAPGTVLVPALRFPWWDAGRGEPRAVTLPALTFEVAAAGAGDGAPARRQMALAAAALLAVLVLVLVVSARRRWRGDEARHRHAAFRRAAQRNDAQAAYAAFLRWQAVAGDAAAAPVLGPPLRELEEALVAGAPWHGRHLCEALRASLRQSSSRPLALASLNPSR